MPRNSISMAGMAGTRKVYSSLQEQVLAFIYISKGPESGIDRPFFYGLPLWRLAGIYKRRTNSGDEIKLIVAAASD